MSEDMNLSGVWEGSYAYSGGDVGELEFKLRLKDVDGELRGLVVEPNTETGGNRRAQIEGNRTDREIKFVKNYINDDPHVQEYTRPVTYEGTVNADNDSISGSWFLPDDRGSFSIKRADG